MTLRKFIFWLHLAAGIAAGIVVLIMSLTGVLLTYEKQMIAWADSDYVRRESSAGAQRLTTADIISKIQEAAGSPPQTITLYAASPTVSAAAGGSTWYLDAQTGEVLGVSAPRLRRFFRTVTDWHRYVALSGDNRATGKAITGASNLVFLFIVVSGVFIWWPRKATQQSLRTATWFKRGLQGKARNWNWHNTFGVWTAFPLFFVVLSATVISYPWATNLVYTLTGTENQPAGGGGGGGGRGGAGGGNARPERNERAANAGAEAAPALEVADIDPLIRRAEKEIPDWKTIAVRIPAASERRLTFTIDKGNGGQPQLRSTLILDRNTGELTSIEKFEDQNLGRRTRSWMRFVHTGEYYGFLGQTIAGVASFAGVMLVWTGFALSLNRFGSWLKRRARKSEPEGQTVSSVATD
jgi:uncharacterized iron-regulated membrane protein